MNSLDNNYTSILTSLKAKIRQAQVQASVAVNSELLKLYWLIGYTILQQQKKHGWGAKIIDNLSNDLLKEFPDFKGLSVRNLKYMRAFAELYPNSDSIVQPVVAQLTWTHHTILSKVKNSEELTFYRNATIENGWSKNILAMQIKNRLFHRQGKAISNFQDTLPPLQSDLVKETLKNPYMFDFLALSEKMQEREFEQALLQNLKKFMLELGKGFAYVGNQKNLNVDGDDFFLDLLFYNYRLHCFVVFELKVGEFKPEYAGKLNFYVNAVNEQIKGERDSPTIGVLLCKTPNETVVRYSLQGIESPIGVSEYLLEGELPHKLIGGMPTIEELEAELDKEFEELRTPIDKKLDTLKQAIASLNQPTVQEKLTSITALHVFDTVVIPFKNYTLNALTEKLVDMFDSVEALLWIDNKGYNSDKEAREDLIQKGICSTFRINIVLKGFKPAGTQAFSIEKDIIIKTNEYAYSIEYIKYQIIIFKYDKLYHEDITEQERNTAINLYIENILDELTERVNKLSS